MFYEIRWKTNEQLDRPITDQEKISIKIKWVNAYLFKVIWEHFVEKGEIFYCFFMKPLCNVLTMTIHMLHY